MEWIDALRGNVVAVDTTPLIYYMEENPRYLPAVTPFFAAVARGEFRAITSIITLVEVLVHPLRRGNVVLAQQYRDILFNAEGLTTILLSEDIAEESARLRAMHNLRTPDAIQMATAIRMGAECLVTNDLRLPSLPDLRVIALDNYLF